MPFVPPEAVILLVSNPVTSSENVNVNVTSPLAAVVASSVIATVGETVSTVIAGDVPAVPALPAASV